MNPSDLGFTARAVTRSYTNGSGATFGYAHDANGNQTQLTLPDGKIISYAYDNRDRLTTITDWAGRISTLAWDIGSRLVSVTRPNGTVRAFFYDGASQMTRIEERTSAGRLIQMVKLGLDDLGRAEKRFTVPLPTAASFPAPNYTYNKDNWINELDYDADGNMKTLPAVPAPIGQPNLRALPGLKTTAGTLATWDSRNRLTSIKLADGSTQQYKYDAENQRTHKITGTQTTTYTHNAHGLSGMSECTVEVLPDGSQRLYIWGGPAGLLYDVSIPANSTTETLRYYHADQVGSTMALTNQAGAVIGRADYTPYGLITLRSGDTDTPFLYNGAYGVMTDSETGLVHMRARYYHPWLARFINADPSGFGGGMNMYVFANGNPVMMLDALGLDAHRYTINSSSFAQGSLGRSPLSFAQADWSSLSVASSTNNNYDFHRPDQVAAFQWNSARMNEEQNRNFNRVVDIAMTAASFTPIGRAAAVGRAATGVRVANATVRAESSLSGQLLRQDLLRQEAASAFTASGQLSPGAISGSRVIIPAGQLGNPNIPAGFSKMSTRTFQSPSGDFQTHFYQNTGTGVIDYSLDFKIKFN